MEEKQKVILAYSGGLDTSVILKWLIEMDYEVVCYMADVGQIEDFDVAKKKALKIGAKKVVIEDLKKEFVTDYIFEALKTNAMYEGQYLLGTSLARPLISKKIVELAKSEGTNKIAHGATGKGNDQVRFEMTFMVLMPDVEIISPWKNELFLAKFEGRSDLLEYAKEHGIPLEQTAEKPYSMDDNLMHISYEAGQLEDPKFKPTKDMFKKTLSPMDAPDNPTEIIVEFKEGIPIKVLNVNLDEEFDDPLEIFNNLNKIGSENGIGRLDMVENRFIGMKSRGVYETPAGTILWKAHKDIESLTIDKEVNHLKETLMPKIAQIIYNGFWFSPEYDFLMAAINQSQKYVEGKVHMTLYKGNVIVDGRESEKSIYNKDIASMDKEGGYDQKDAKGFIKLNALRLKLGVKHS